RPAAPSAAAPVARPAPWTAADAADDEDDDEADDDDRQRNRHSTARLANGLLRHADALERDAAGLRDASDDALGSGEQAGAVLPGAKMRRHVVAARLAGEPVGDEFLETVADLDADAAFLRRQQDQHARSEEHTSELQSPYDLVCRLLLEKKNKKTH